MAKNMVTRAFTAPSLRAFWRYWNAGTNYYLLYYCYGPLRSYLGHRASLALTFAVCGLAHDALLVLPVTLLQGKGLPFPFVTCWFLLVAAGVLATDGIGLDLVRLGPSQRVAIHTAFITATFLLTIGLSRLW